MTRARGRTVAWAAALVVAALVALLGIASVIRRVHLDWRGEPTVQTTPAPMAVPAPGSAARGPLPGPPGAAPPSSTSARRGALEPHQVVATLKSRSLLVPVRGVEAGDLRPTFFEARGSRVHEALDIMAPAGTPVQAVEDGTIARLFTSEAGGLTVYQFDPSRLVAYYYAHLQRYAPGLADGAPVRRGQVLGYVGSSGNADPAAPHLHFAISVLGPEQQWWEGTPLDPYEVLR